MTSSPGLHRWALLLRGQQTQSAASVCKTVQAGLQCATDLKFKTKAGMPRGLVAASAGQAHCARVSFRLLALCCAKKVPGRANHWDWTCC